MRSIFLEPIDPPQPGEVPYFEYAFDITRAEEAGNPARLRIEALAESKDGVAGFGVEFDRSGWRRDQVYADIWFDYGTGSLFSLGVESDAFARFLSAELGDGRQCRFVDRLAVDVAMLNSDPDKMMTEPCRSKFFLGDSDETEAQVFINFDLSRGTVEFREKDLDYRESLLDQLVVH
jgi:hypothetical protein